MQDATIRDEVEKRLGDLFDEKVPYAKVPGTAGDPAVFPLKELKATVLSVDWEINDQTMDRLIDHTEQLQSAYGNDRVVSTFLKLLGSIGRYIRTNKANAHPDAVKLLNSIYLKLEKVILSHEISQESRKGMLLTEVEKFKSLQGKIAQRMAAQGTGDRVPMGPAAIGLSQGFGGGRKPSVSPEQRPEAARGKRTPADEALARVAEEIKKTISAEFAALRAEIRAWREGK